MTSSFSVERACVKQTR